jgi:Zn-dependent M28 family amino/carboxypeptidase
MYLAYLTTNDKEKPMSPLRKTTILGSVRWSACLLFISLLAACGGGNDTPATAAAAPEPSSSALVVPAEPSSSVMSTEELAAAGVDSKEMERAQKLNSASGGLNLRCLLRRNDTPEKLTECVTLDGVRFHQRVLQAIADRNNGTRVSGTKGYDQSADYAELIFKLAGYEVSRENFEFQAFIKLTPSQLQQVTPSGSQTITHTIFSYSGSGDVTAPVSQPTVSTGCNTADFANFTAGNIALISRGACNFSIKVTNAAAAGAKAVVVYNNREGAVSGGTLGDDFKLDVPAVSVTQVKGSELLTISGLVLRVKTDTFRGTATTSNIIAQSKEGDPNNVVMVGAHLDSVDEGPGINDNGSGSAAILETAIQMSRVKPKNKVRFALWGAEESGLVGSEKYVEKLTDEEKSRIALYLNFDMVGSPNPVYFIYDGDNSDGVGAGPGPAGSGAIEKLFEKFYTERKLPFKGTDFDGRSDYGPFITVGIPSGGLFTGAEGIKTAEEAQLWGGTAGEAYDKCYHQACDTYDNVNLQALDVNADAVAYNTLVWSMDVKALGTREKPTQRSNTASQPSSIPKWSAYPKLERQ